MGMYMKGIVGIIKDRSHATSHAIWDCHLYPVAVGTLSASQGFTYRSFKSLDLLKFSLILAKKFVVNK